MRNAANQPCDEKHPLHTTHPSKKHDTQLLIGHIILLTREKSNTRHFIGLHRFANENLLCCFSVGKSQYVYNKYNVLTAVTGLRVTGEAAGTFLHLNG